MNRRIDRVTGKEASIYTPPEDVVELRDVLPNEDTFLTSPGPCDWCDRPTMHRHVSAEGEVKACHLHFDAYLGLLARRRNLKSRTEQTLKAAGDTCTCGCVEGNYPCEVGSAGAGC